MTKNTSEDQKSRKVIATYLSEDYRDIFNEMLDKMGINRYDYLKGLVLSDMVRRKVMNEAEVRRKDRYLLDIFDVV